VSPGQLARRLLGPRLFPRVGRAYRALFVDMAEVVACFPPLPPAARVLDIGGGDGELLNVLLARHPGARATLIDVRADAGAGLAPALRPRVEVWPATDLAQYRTRAGAAPLDLVVLSDVVHHVPAAAQPAFLDQLAALLAAQPAAALVIKDVRRGGWRSWLCALSDRYVSGDRQARFLVEDELEALVQARIPFLTARRTALHRRNPPNYCLVFQRGAAS
jgi:2-polyprenyl-3-methyl-5-hydroxy-6-metoxy-1,4-benzoquinol methylase